MADYRPEQCAYCSAETWCEIRANGNPQCRACKVERFFSEILYPPLNLTLMWWQRKVLRDIYGTVLPETGERQYRHCYISVAKQNGKSFCLGGLPIYHLLVEDELNPEVCGCAAAKDQGAIIFKATAQLINANSDLRHRFKILESTKRILCRHNAGVYAVLSADGDVQDGKRPSLLLRDEVHRWTTQKAETLQTILTKGQISRREPLDIGISTAGAEFASPLWHRQYETAKQILSGAVQMPNRYAAIWEADARRIENDPEYWKSREARVAANPSHEDHPGGFLKDAAIVDELEKAIMQPAERSNYLRYNLNVPVKSEQDPIIDMAKWQGCGGGEDLRTWPEYDLELLIRKWRLHGRRCWVGVDASWSVDLTSAVFVFPPEGDEEPWTLLPFFWIPSDPLSRLERVCRVPLATWVHQKFIEMTPGAVIDQNAIVEKIKWGCEAFDLREVAYDRCNFRMEAVGLQEKDGIAIIEVPQTFAYLSQPTKFLLGAYVARNVRHANHPVLNWMASCLQLQYDHKDNCQPSKPERMKSSKRIDGIQATVTALVRALVPGNTGSIYDTQTIKFL